MRENSILKERILQFLDFKGINKKNFYEITGISNGILSQNNGISEDNLMRFLNFFPEISPTWLLTGEGSMLKGGEGKEVAEAKEPGNKGNINAYLLEYIELLKEKLAKVEADLEEHRQRTKSAATQAERKSA